MIEKPHEIKQISGKSGGRAPSPAPTGLTRTPKVVARYRNVPCNNRFCENIYTWALKICRSIYQYINLLRCKYTDVSKFIFKECTGYGPLRFKFYFSSHVFDM